MMCHVLFHGASAYVSPLRREWSKRSLALLLRPVASDAPSVAQLRLTGTSCAGTGPPGRKAALADHYGRCREHTSSGSWSS